MGMFFSNIHIKTTEDFSINDVKKFMNANMTDKGYICTDDNNEAEITVGLYYSDDSKWITVMSDTFMFDEPNDAQKIAVPFSNKFHTYVIAASCIDSDYLMMNLINTFDGTDGFINVGDNYGMPYQRNTEPLPWTKVVTNYEAFLSLINDKHVFAEEVLFSAAEMLGMNTEQCCLSTKMLEMVDAQKLVILKYKMDSASNNEPPKFEIPRFNLMPCKIGRSHCVSVNNKGGSSKGIAVQFQGDYIENDELTFEDVVFEYRQNGERITVPIKLNKYYPPEGKPVLCWYDKDFIIPPAVNPDIPQLKKMDLEFEKEFGIRFTPCGNSRKTLDVKVFIYPLDNPKGSACWYVYKSNKTKRNYIDSNNENWNRSHLSEAQRAEVMLNPDDFDLDD